MAAYPKFRFRSSVVLLLIGLLALSGISPIKLHAWIYNRQEFSRQANLLRVETIPPVVTGDLDGDGIQERISIHNGRAEITGANGSTWSSPAGWQVKQAILADLNRDDRLEVALVVWRDFRPWPVDQFMPNGGRITGFHDLKGKSCHLILIGWKKNGYGEVWAGSALAEPLLMIASVDFQGDGKQELVALETDYQDLPGSPARAFSTWEWNGFGFSLIMRAKGAFRQLQVLMLPTHQPVIQVLE